MLILQTLFLPLLLTLYCVPPACCTGCLNVQADTQAATTMWCELQPCLHLLGPLTAACNHEGC